MCACRAVIWLSRSAISRSVSAICWSVVLIWSWVSCSCCCSDFLGLRPLEVVAQGALQVVDDVEAGARVVHLVRQDAGRTSDEEDRDGAGEQHGTAQHPP